MQTYKRRPKRRHKKRKHHLPIWVIVIVAVVSCSLIGGTIAWLTSSSSLSNLFGVGTLELQIHETFENNVKENVYIENKGTTDVYVRAQIHAYYEDVNGTILSGTPIAGTDYELIFGTSGKWIEKDGMYYHTSPVKKDSEVLIQKCVERDTETHRAEGKYLVVDVIAEGIQADPSSAVETAWGIKTGANGELEVNP